jgi:hypothetical protein
MMRWRVEGVMVTTRGLTIDQVKGDTDWSALEEDLLAECPRGASPGW